MAKPEGGSTNGKVPHNETGIPGALPDGKPSPRPRGPQGTSLGGETASGVPQLPPMGSEQSIVGPEYKAMVDRYNALFPLIGYPEPKPDLPEMGSDDSFVGPDYKETVDRLRAPRPFFGFPQPEGGMPPTEAVPLASQNPPVTRVPEHAPRNNFAPDPILTDKGIPLTRADLPDDAPPDARSQQDVIVGAEYYKELAKMDTQGLFVPTGERIGKVVDGGKKVAKDLDDSVTFTINAIKGTWNLRTPEGRAAAKEAWGKYKADVKASRKEEVAALVEDVDAMFNWVVDHGGNLKDDKLGYTDEEGVHHSGSLAEGWRNYLSAVRGKQESSVTKDARVLTAGFAFVGIMGGILAAAVNLDPYGEDSKSHATLKTGTPPAAVSTVVPGTTASGSQAKEVPCDNSGSGGTSIVCETEGGADLVGSLKTNIYQDPNHDGYGAMTYTFQQVDDLNGVNDFGTHDMSPGETVTLQLDDDDGNPSGINLNVTRHTGKPEYTATTSQTNQHG